MLLRLPLDILKVIMRVLGMKIFDLRVLCVDLYRYIPMSQLYNFHIIINSDMKEFANTFTTDTKLFKDSVFDIFTYFKIDQILLHNTFKNIRIRNLYIRDGPLVLSAEPSDLSKKLEIARCKLPFAETTTFNDMTIGQDNLYRLNTNTLRIKNCRLTEISMYELPLLNIRKLEIKNSKNVRPIVCGIPALLKELKIDRTVFCEQLLFNICLSNLEHLTIPCHYNIAQYVQHFPKTLKTLCIIDCGALIYETINSLLINDISLYITHTKVNKVIECVFPTREISEIQSTSYILTKDDMVMYIEC